MSSFFEVSRGVLNKSATLVLPFLLVYVKNEEEFAAWLSLVHNSIYTFNYCFIKGQLNLHSPFTEGVTECWCGTL